MSESGLIDFEIIERIKKYSQNLGFFYKLFKDRHVPVKTKKIIHSGRLQTILLYGSETLNINMKNVKKITATDMKVVRMINGVTKMNKIHYDDLCKALHLIPIANEIKNCQIRRFGHVRRRPPDHPIAVAYNCTVEGNAAMRHKHIGIRAQSQNEPSPYVEG
ncbi:uncharacterized protein [Watersipora subatra]|uniref:uncharacterized protein n=1 Tax=Watersipora subatra TaxID=2589382 RepID=UPI00355B6287